MASAICRVAARNATKIVRKSLPGVTSVRFASDSEVTSQKVVIDGKNVTPERSMPNELGHAVGKQRYELFGIREGVDVWDDQPFTPPKDRGTFANPIIVEHPYPERSIACLCGGGFGHLCDKLLFKQFLVCRISFEPIKIELHNKKRIEEITPEVRTEVAHTLASDRFELFEKFAGREDPFEVAVRKTITNKDEVNIVPSMREERLVGCICEEDSTEITWWTLKKGQTVQCGCGHRFLLTGLDDDVQPLEQMPDPIGFYEKKY